MKIGIVRHFKVAYQPGRKRMTVDQFNEWVEQYNKSNILPGNFDSSGHEWNVCLSSDLPRAVHTATQIYSGDIIYTEQLREVEISTTSRTGIKLHRYVWLGLGRIAWYVGHSSQSESRASTILRTNEVIELLERDYGSSNVLLVTHGAFMKVLTQQLSLRGYNGNGKRILHPRNGELYVYEKDPNI